MSAAANASQPRTLALIAPSSTFNQARYEAGVALLGEQLALRKGAQLQRRAGYLAGTDAERLQDLRWALGEPGVDALMAVRGGYGATRLLGELSVEEVQKASRPLLGFSDLSALHCLWSRAGVPSLHGPMVCSITDGSRGALRRVLDLLHGRQVAPLRAETCLVEGRAEGVLVGGNLSVLAALAGTDHAPPLKGAILLLEDVGEAPYRVDRMLTTLIQAGWMDQLAGIALGAFSNCAAGPDGTTVEQTLRERLTPLGKPLLAGLPIGHIADNQAVVLGRPAQLDAGAGTLEHSALDLETS